MIEITKNAKDYINSKKIKDITIQCPNHRMQCCSVSVPTPEVYLKKPSDTGFYELFTIDGYNIYISKILRKKKNITIDLNKILMVKYLTVDGFDLWS